MGLFALLMVSSRGIVDSTLDRQLEDAPLINQAGRQRMLSQKIVKCALAIQGGVDRRAELSAALEEWEAAHRALLAAFSPSGQLGDEGRAIYGRLLALQPTLEAIAGAARALIEGEGGEAEVELILAREGSWLVQMNTAVGEMEALAGEDIAWLETVELWLLGLSLLALAYEALFVFRPAVIGVQVEVEQRVHARLQRAEALEAARAALKAREEFLVNISHELRTPLNAISGALEMLDFTQADGAQREWLGVLRGASADLQRQVYTLLELADHAEDSRESDRVDFEVEALLEALLRSFHVRAAQRGLELEAVVDEDAPRWLRGDAGRLRQLLDQLVDNAVKYTERGQVWVRARRVPGGEGPGVRLQLEVGDTGIGIPEAAQGSIFEAFRQVDGSLRRAANGAGVGLALCKRLVEQLGGEIAVQSSPGVGTVFVITLDVERAEVEAAQAA
jgi:signal transduction histidine kinase